VDDLNAHLEKKDAIEVRSAESSQGSAPSPGADGHARQCPAQMLAGLRLLMPSMPVMPLEQQESQRRS
jgi:hypothetical protein